MTTQSAVADTPSNRSRQIVRADVVVTGGGGAGLAAAIEAASLGRHVVLLEKNDKLGGSTAWSVGSVTATNTPHQLRQGIKDCSEHHFEDMGLFCAKLGMPDNEVLRRVLVDNASDTFRWLVESGVEFFGPLPEPPHRKPRMHNVLPNSRAFIYHLEKRARGAGVEIRTGVCAQEFLLRDGVVTGVLADVSGSAVEFQAAGGVVLATGDFSGSAEMRARYISPSMENVRPINATNTGDGHRMVLALGGRIIHPDFHLAGIRFQAPPDKWITRLPPYRWLTRLMSFAMGNLPDWILRPFVMSFLTTILLPSPHLYAEGAILINKDGERFADEMGNPAPLMAAQRHQLAYIVLDGKLADKFSRWPDYISTAPGIAYAYLQDYRRNRKDIFYEAATLPELAARLGVPADRLQQSVAKFNESVGRGETGSRPKLDRGPYVALGPVRYYINFTDSGIAINDKLEVLGAGDVPVQGIYAAGFVGMGGMLLEGHGHHLAWAFVSGRLAGRAAAMRALSADLPRSEGHSYRSPAGADAAKH